MVSIIDETTFQHWVEARFQGAFGHIQDFSAVGGFVPDLSAALMKQDYWLELKYARFNLLHGRYDDFMLPNLTRGQLQWLHHRSKCSSTICGVLAYIVTVGDHSKDFSTDYLFFMTAENYLRSVWGRKINSGGIILSPYAVAAHCVKTGAALRDFIEAAASGGAYNGGQL